MTNLFNETIWHISAAWGSKILDCTLDGIVNRCFGQCCHSPTFWPPCSGEGGCPLLGPAGCTLEPPDKPVVCLLYPLVLNRCNKLVLHRRVCQAKHYCGKNYNVGTLTVVEALRGNLETLFGDETAALIVQSVLCGLDYTFVVPKDVVAALRYEKEVLEPGYTVPISRSLYPIGER